MKRKKTWLFVFLTAFLCALVCALCCCGGTGGGNGDNSSVQTNSEAKYAERIEINTAITDNLAYGSEENWYQFEVAQNGYIHIDFQHAVLSSTSSFWRFYLYGADGVTAYTGEKEAWTVKGNENVSTAQMGVCAGKYYVQVISANYGYSEEDYTLTVHYTQSNEWETENNGTVQTATKIPLKTAVYGNISNIHDTDWYQFTLEKDGYFTFDFAHETVPSTYELWALNIYGSDGVSYYANVDKTWDAKGNSNVSSAKMGASAGAYYIKITKDSSYCDIKYTLTVHYTESNDWETENNGTVQTATKIPLNTAVYGNLITGYDDDWYQFTLEKAGYFTFDFAHETVPSTDRLWALKIYSSDGVTDYTNVNKTWYAKGNENISSVQMGADAGTYYILVEAKSNNDSIYNLTVHFTEHNSWEKENNGNIENANTISLNNTYHGTIINDGDAWAYKKDVDVYMLTISPETGLKLTFQHTPLSTDNVCWKITVYGADGISKITEADVKGTEESKQIVWTGTGTFYIAVTEGSMSYSEEAYTILAERLDS